MVPCFLLGVPQFSKMVPRFYSEVWSQVSTDLTGKGWAQSQSQGLLSNGDKFKMVNPVEGLQNLVVKEIEGICCSLRNPTAVSNVQEALETIDQIVYGVNCLDSVTRLPDDVYRGISSAKRIIENASSTSARIPRIITNMPGRPSYGINEDQLRLLIDLRFPVPQISELLHVSTRTIERRLAEYGISARSFSTSWTV